MSAGLLVVPNAQPSFDREGRAVLAYLRFYDEGTTDPATVYQDEALTSAHDFPVVSNSSGQFPLMWADTEARFTVNHSTADGQSVTHDGITAATGTDLTILTATEAARDEAVQVATDLGDLQAALAAAAASELAAGNYASAAAASAAAAALSATGPTGAQYWAGQAEFWAGQAEAAAGGDFQASNALLTAIAALTMADNKLIVGTGSNAVEVLDFSTVAQTLVAQTTQALMRTTGLGMSANGSALVEAANYAAMKALLDLEIGTDVQAFHANLSALAGLSLVADRLPYANGTGTLALATLTAAGRAILDDADAAAQRTTLDAEQLGVARGINTQTDSYTLVASDAGKFVHMNKASGVNLTVPPNSSVAFAVGTYVNIYQQGAGQVTVVAGSGVTIRSSGSKLKLTGQYSGALLWKTATDTWELVGDITS